uniref:Uncharacterized protein n=1 Tax=Cacopsylla melanoneura TaxID=428564 RepID=A0A8D8LFF5_9HEMI
MNLWLISQITKRSSSSGHQQTYWNIPDQHFFDFFFGVLAGFNWWISSGDKCGFLTLTLGGSIIFSFISVSVSWVCEPPPLVLSDRMSIPFTLRLQISKPA